MPDCFAERLATAVKKKKTPLIVGLDPRWDSLPPALLQRATEHPGVSPVEAKAAAYRDFCLGVIDVIAPLVPAVKPQAAFFEQLGWPGMKALAEVIDVARARGLLVVADCKRNDTDGLGRHLRRK
jgi:orotidine-5'-phosphate decarboxylase